MKVRIAAIFPVIALVSACSGDDGGSGCSSECEAQTAIAEFVVRTTLGGPHVALDSAGNVSMTVPIDEPIECDAGIGSVTGNVVLTSAVNFADVTGGTLSSSFTGCDLGSVSLDGGPLAYSDLHEGAGGWAFDANASTLQADGLPCGIDLTVEEIDDVTHVDGEWCGVTVHTPHGDG